MKYLIEKNIPIPAVYQESEFYYLAEKMEIGDSVRLESSKDADKLIGALTKLGFKGSRRRISDTEFRVWRVKTFEESREDRIKAKEVSE